jgi:hypothetical protein
MAKAPAPKQELTKTSQHGNLPAEFLDQVAADAGMGSEGVSGEDMALPQLKIAQKLSPEVDTRDALHIPGLNVGDFFNSASQIVYPNAGDGALFFIPVYFERKYLEWTPRDAGGGFNGEHGPEVMEKTKPNGSGGNFLANGNEIVVTGTWFGIIVSTDGSVVEQGVISLSKTQLKKSRQLMTKLKAVALPHPQTKKKFNPPLFYNRLRVSSIPENNDQGNWEGWKFELAGSIFDLPNDMGTELYDTCKMMFEAVRSGAVKASQVNNAPLNDGGGNDEGGNDKGEDPPF